MRLLGALVASPIIFVLGCGSYLGSAQRAYDEGRYLEAAESLSSYEAKVVELPPAKQANYGLYRGLSLMMLGDHDDAGKWLDFAAAIEKKRPGSLMPAQRRELEVARAKLAKTDDTDSDQTLALPTRSTESTP